MTTKATKNLHQRLAEAMDKVRYVQKEKKQGMQYSVVSHDHVTAKVRPALLEAGIVYYPVNLSYVQNGNRTEVMLSVRFVNTDNPEDFIEVPSLGFGIDSQDKGSGKAISYAVKYALLKALGLETGDDPDLEQNVQHTPDPDAITAEDRKAQCQKAADENADSVTLIKEGIAENDLVKAAEAWYELDNDTKMALFLAPSKGGCFSTEERAVMKTSEFRQAYYGQDEAA